MGPDSYEDEISLRALEAKYSDSSSDEDLPQQTAETPNAIHSASDAYPIHGLKFLDEGTSPSMPNHNVPRSPRRRQKETSAIKEHFTSTYVSKNRDDSFLAEIGRSFE